VPPSPSKKRGAPPGNHNAQRHGYYAHRRKTQAGPSASQGAPALNTQATRDGDQPAHAAAIAAPPGDGAVPGKPAPIPSQEDLVTDLYGRQKSLLDYLQKHNGDLAFEHRIAAEALYTKNASALSRMIRNVGAGDRRLTDAINAALDAMAKELGLQL